MLKNNIVTLDSQEMTLHNAVVKLQHHCDNQKLYHNGKLVNYAWLLTPNYPRSHEVVFNMETLHDFVTDLIELGSLADVQNLIDGLEVA